MTIRFLLIIVFAIAALAVTARLLDDSVSPLDTSVTISEALGAGIDSEEMRSGMPYLRAEAQREFEFPADHGPHEGYKLEWWYFTGNLAASDGRRYGYQFTIFRSALSPEIDVADKVEDATAYWATNQLYSAHFALTDVDRATFSSSERFSRGAADLAGARADPFRVWVDDWSVVGVGDNFTLRLQAVGEGYSLDLELTPEKPIVLQGDRGLSPKGNDPGQASYYYSIPRFKTSGTVDSGAGGVEVQGASWMDREWSTSLLGSDQTGWDWFSLQLDDDRELMYFQLRNRQEDEPPFTEGSLIDAQGQVSELGNVELSVIEEWTSPVSQITYPSGWDLLIPDHDLELQVVPLLKGQELNVSVRYWEGAVQILDGDGVPRGYGYVELTGYGEEH